MSIRGPVVPEGYHYAYCRLDSPQDLQANLLTGLSHSQCRLYLNGRDLGTLDGRLGWEGRPIANTLPRSAPAAIGG